MVDQKADCHQKVSVSVAPVDSGSARETLFAVFQKYRSSLREYSKEVKRAKLVNWRKFVISRKNAEA